ncbi:MAG: hypothetical protein GY809_20865, partial [Planctomycetes bacterium]|nr:hypothetical protein [Planctomycetota bacterium]
TPLAVLKGDPAVIDMVQWSPDGTQIAGGNWWQNSTCIWDVATESTVRVLPACCVKWSVTGHDVVKWLSSKKWGDIEVWDAETGRLTATLTGHTSYVSRISWSPDGDNFVSASDDQTFRLWDSATGRMIRNFQGHTDEVLSVYWSPDGTCLLSASLDGTAKIWTIKE